VQCTFLAPFGKEGNRLMAVTAKASQSVASRKEFLALFL